MSTINNHRQIWIFFSLLLFLISSNIIHALYFNTVGGDDAVFGGHAVNLLQNKFGIDLYGDLLGRSSYWFSYPPLHSLLTVLSFEIFGINYKAGNIFPIIFYSLILIYLYFYYKSRFELTVLLGVLLLLGLDPLFLSYTRTNRPEMTVIFFFTVSALSYLDGEEKKSNKLIFFSGIYGGLAFFASLNALWLPLSLFLYKMLSKNFLREFKILLIYYFGFVIVNLPYYLWIFIDNQRLKYLFQQVLHSSSGAEGIQFSMVFKKLLNPAADLYLMMFRGYSIYPIIFAISMLLFIRNYQKYKYFFCILIVPFFMMIINRRGSNYLLITMPFCYVAFAYVLRDVIKGNRFSLIKKCKKAGMVGLVLLLLFDFGLNLSNAFQTPSFIMDIDYYSKVLKENTEKESRVVTDPALALSASDGRKIISVATLIWDRWRMLHTYDEIFRVLDPDYIILTERMRKWGEMGKQSRAFQELIKTNFILTKYIENEKYGKLWIYKRVKVNNEIIIKKNEAVFLEVM